MDRIQPGRRTRPRCCRDSNPAWAGVLLLVLRLAGEGDQDDVFEQHTWGQVHLLERVHEWAARDRGTAAYRVDPVVRLDQLRLYGQREDQLMAAGPVASYAQVAVGSI